MKYGFSADPSLRSQSSTEMRMSFNCFFQLIINKIRIILTEAQEECVNCHRVNSKEDASNQICANHDDDHWHLHVVQLYRSRVAGEVDISDGAHSQRDQNLGQKEQELGDLVQSDDS